MSNFKKVMSVTLCLVILLTVLPGVNIKAESQSILNIMEDGTIFEREMFIDSDNTNVIMERTTLPSGRATLTVKKGDTKLDYNSIINYNQLRSFSDSSHKLRRVDVHGSNFIHQLLSTNSKSITRQEAKAGAAAITTIISMHLGIPLSFAGILGRLVYEMISDNGKIYSVTVNEQIYEVYFKADNIYFTHCYHETIYSYDSGGHLISTTINRYEQVGG